jgi:hypothetical protein
MLDATQTAALPVRHAAMLLHWHERLDQQEGETDLPRHMLLQSMPWMQFSEYT